jgi:NAD(P)-dependent dehydrogenase (short-subunit alcohol dehydrogenase family)
MHLTSLLAAAGLATVLFSACRFAAFMRIYLRPASLEKYLGNGAFAVVTGATDGIGKAVAMELAGRGFNIVLHGRDAEKLAAVSGQLQKAHTGRKVVTIVHDAGANSRLDTAALRALPISVLVNNVGGGEPRLADLNCVESLYQYQPRLTPHASKEPTMSNSPQGLLALVLCSAALTGCTTTRPLNYERLNSASQLAPNPHARHGHVPFLYSAANIDWHKYNAVIVDPVVVYSGPDQQFGKASDADKAALAAYMQQQFPAALETKFVLMDKPGPTTLRVHLTLTGIETTTPVLSTLLQAPIPGTVIGVVQTALDKQAVLTGSVSYAVEIYDSATNRLLRAYIAKQYPLAANIFASFGTLHASRTGIRTGARDLVAHQLD